MSISSVEAQNRKIEIRASVYVISIIVNILLNLTSVTLLWTECSQLLNAVYFSVSVTANLMLYSCLLVV